MGFEPLTVALIRSKKHYATKENNLSTVVKDAPKKVLVINNPQQENYLVYINGALIGPANLKEIGAVYGLSGWEVGI